MNERVTVQPQKKAATPAQSLSSTRTSPHQHGCACSKCATGGTHKRSAASAHTTPLRPGHDFGRVRIQAKLAVGALDDGYERGADRVTDQVMSRLQATGHEKSGHYTFRAWFGNTNHPGAREEAVNEMLESGCLCEWYSRNLLGIDAASEEQARETADYLAEKESLGHRTYETGHTEGSY